MKSEQWYVLGMAGNDTPAKTTSSRRVRDQWLTQDGGRWSEERWSVGGRRDEYAEVYAVGPREGGE